MSSVAALVIIPGVFGFLGAYSEAMKPAIGLFGVFLFWLVAVILLAFFAIRLHVPEKSLHGLLVENEDKDEEIQSLIESNQGLEEAINLLSLQVNYCSSARGIMLTHARSDLKTLAELRTAIDDLATPLYLQNEALFGFGSSEQWCFTLYLYSQHHEQLLPVWRRKSANHLSGDKPRIWERGEGHVGKAFVDQKAIITGNASDGEVAEFSTLPPGREKDYDSKTYISYASIPVGPILSEDRRPYGVLVGTSDRPGRFDRENSAILYQISGAVASLLISGNLDIDDIAEVSAGEVHDINELRETTEENSD